MAWTNTTVSATQGQDSVDYWTYRPMKGTVQMRLTDVALPGATAHFMNPARVYVTLIDAAGVVLANDVELRKDWGVLPGFTFIGTVPANRSVRFRVRTDVELDAWPGGVMWNKWTADLRWDNATV